MIEVAVYSSSLLACEQMVTECSRSGLRVIALEGQDPETIKASIGTSPASVLVIEAAGDLQLLMDVTEAAHAAHTLVLATLAEPDACSVISATDVDDFIVAPFAPEELEARVRRLIQRQPDAGAITVDGLEIIPDSYEVTVEGRPLKLTFKEYELLKYLATNPGRVLTRQALLNQIWEYDYYGGTRTVDVHVRRLRAKLGARYGNFIKTVRQVGYKFEP